MFLIEGVVIPRISSYGRTASGTTEVHRAFRRAWRLWAEVTPVHIRKRSRRDADIVISFHHGGEAPPPKKNQKIPKKNSLSLLVVACVVLPGLT